jgi:tetratricopeptide (TPR) repeat protein
MNEGSWQSAIKQLLIATRVHRMQPEYNLALGQCFMNLEDFDEAITYFGNVIRVRPKNILGWTELLKCLLAAEMQEEGVEYADFALEQTDQKPIFLFYKSMFLFACGKTKEAIIQLENGMAINPKLVKKFIELDPSILQHPQVVEIIARYKKQRSIR